MKKSKVQVSIKKIIAVFLCVMLLLGYTAINKKSSFFSAYASDEAKYIGNGVTTKASSVEEAKQNARDVNKQIAEEGIILLKNKANSLPLSSSAKISVFGKNTLKPVYGGSGSSSGGASGIDIYKSLEDAGFSTNPTLKAFYQDNTASGTGRPSSPSMGAIPTGFATGETPVASYSTTVKDTFSTYNDAAVIMISRIGGEGYDLPRTSTATFGGALIAGRESADEHYLELDKNEKDLIQMVSAEFDKVILVLNTAQVIELGFLEDDAYGEVDAALWMGLPGENGFAAVGSILNGDVNPSGRTVDTYATDFTLDPSYKNFSYNGKVGAGTDAAGNEYLNSENGARTGYYEVSYEEGIYVGYRYYETRGYEELQADNTSSWYDDNVVYPFGYGLSYTTFDWTVTFNNSGNIAKNETISVDVKVKNTGTVAGKEVVQLYYSAPYTAGEIEKSHVVLGGFAKTDVLAAGAEETVTIELNVQDMASYDFADLNGNGFKGYEVEDGNYDIYIGKNANDAWMNGDKQTLTVASGDATLKGFTYELDIDGNADGNDNQFDDVSDGIKDRLMTRTDFEGTFPTTPTVADLTKDPEFFAEMVEKVTAEYDADSAWYTDEMPSQQATALTADQVQVVFSDLLGKSYDDPLWDTFLDQFTFAQLTTIINSGAYQTVGIDALGIPKGTTPDGPTGFATMFGAGYNGVFFVSPTVMAATFNQDLMSELGDAWGEEGTWNKIGAVYAPAANIHRSPFAGRNFEYYSEDGLLSGVMSAKVIAGLQSKGVAAMIKHFALNDQETNRTSKGLLTWADEQTLREIYLRPFELMVKDGGATGVMSAFNRIGKTWAGASYALLTNVLRNEWGFVGAVITDFGGQDTYMSVDQAIRAGNDYYLAMGTNTSDEKSDGYRKVSNNPEANTATHVTAARKSVKNVLWMAINSNTINLKQSYANTVKTSFTVMSTSSTVNEVFDISSSQFEAGFSGLTYNLDLSQATPSGISLSADGKITCTELGEFTVKVYLMDGAEYVPNTLTEFTINVLSLEDYIADLESQISNLANDITELEKDLKTLNDKNTSLTTEVESLKTELASAKVIIENLQTLVNTLKTDAAATNDLIEKINTELAELKSKIQNLETKNTELESKIIDLENKIDDLEDLIDEMQKQIDDLKANSGSGGCGSAITSATGITALIVVAIAAVGLVFVVVRKKRNN